MNAMALGYTLGYIILISVFFGYFTSNFILNSALVTICMSFIIGVIKISGGTIIDNFSLLVLFVIGISVVFLICYALNAFFRYIELEQPYVKFGKYSIPIDDRVRILSLLWVVTLLITGTLGLFSRSGVKLVSPAFYVSWSEDVIFFSIVGLGVALIGLRLPQHEEFSNRLAILFSGAKVSDTTIRNPALFHIGIEVKKLGFVVSSSKRRLVVKKYSKDYDAYYIEVTSTAILSNLFGDVDIEDDIKFGVTPDDFTDREVRPAVIGYVTSLYVEGEGEKFTKHIELIQEGIRHKEKFKVGVDPKIFHYRYEAWFRNGQNMSHTPSRFCRHQAATILNHMTSGDASIVYFRDLSEGGREVTLRYGEEHHTKVETDIAPGVKKPLAVFLDPLALASAHEAE